MYKEKHVAVIIAAGGNGLRFASEVPKQFVEICGRTVLMHAAMPFIQHKAVDEILFVLPSDRIDMTADLLVEQFGSELIPSWDALDAESDFLLSRDLIAADPLKVKLTSGGSDRTASVRNGLSACSFKSGVVFVHDAARPYVSVDVIDRVLDATYRYGAAIPTIPVTDTIYRTNHPDAAATEPELNSESNVPHLLLDVPNRNTLYAVQTPQGFDLELIREAHLKAERQGISFTDDGALVKNMSDHLVTLVEGDPANIKITRQDDVITPSGITRVGIGFDAHRFTENRRLILGGVEIPYYLGLLGHSDADVLIHALMDAMLGALSLGDIGKFFPDTDKKYKNANSMKLLAEVRNMIEEKGYLVSNADLVIVAEKPRLAAYISTIRKSIAKALGVSPDAIGVKATTTEGLGFTGREEGIGSQAIVMLAKSEVKTLQNRK